MPQIVKGCEGSPLVLQVMAGSLHQQPFVKWQNMKKCFMSRTNLKSNSTKYATMQDLHREQAIHQSKVEPFEQRKRQEIIELNAQLKKNDALQIRIKKLVGAIVALSCIVCNASDISGCNCLSSFSKILE
ncbi:putative CC-NBS-LRR resistance protein [Trifolium pratense]|uniref:Putative CC-NBS-LRR resistance protein n=1 Tax=Trifolium pratense TaxID=57577 RepID=A0A2K3LLW3_TRIPR|nr:putative CC-NBS-LRR resistance protein [Trifolium pratense]